jgi:hypothetical protein
VPNGKSRRKGAKGELDVVTIINDEFELMGMTNLKAERVLTESRESSFDVQLRHRIRGPVSGADIWPIMPIAIQVKNMATNFGSWMLKAWREAFSVENHIPISVVKVPSKAGMNGRDKWLASVELVYFANLLGKAHSYDYLIEVMRERLEAIDPDSYKKWLEEEKAKGVDLSRYGIN